MYISLFLLLVLLFGVAAALFLYRFQGRRNVIQLDIVQFLYIFLFYPVFFVWIKSFIYVQVRGDLGAALTANEFFLIDTAVSLTWLYLYGIFAIKGFTKTLFLARHKDPLADLFEHTEYFHLWISHLAIFFGVAIISLILAGINVFLPFQVPNATITTLFVACIGSIVGIFMFVMLLLSDPKQNGYRLLKVVKLVYGFVFTVLISLYLFIEPPFTTAHSMYWLVVFMYASFVVCSIFSYKSSRANSWLDRFTNLFRDLSWGNNISLEKSRGKRKA